MFQTPKSTSMLPSIAAGTLQSGVDDSDRPTSHRMPIFWSWIEAVEGSGEEDGFADVVEVADPGYGSLDYAHTEDALALHGWIVSCRVRAGRECPP
jgi:hypothetical protein